jgi:hypothetical protein
MWGLIILTILIYLLRKLVLQKRVVSINPVWGCGYVAPTIKQQFTAGSFVRSYSKINNPTLLFFKNEKEVSGIFPAESHYESHAYDKIEKWLVDKPIKAFKSFLGRFLFLQNGRLQSYILYGVIFILVLIFIPMIFEKIDALFAFLKQL